MHFQSCSPHKNGEQFPNIPVLVVTKHDNEKQLGENQVYFIHRSVQLSIFKSSEDRNSSRAGALQAGADAKGRESTAYRLEYHGFTVRFLIEPRITCPGVAQPIISGPSPINH